VPARTEHRPPDTRHLVVRHKGYADPADDARKLERDIRILDLELWFRKAVVHRHRGKRAEAEWC
jgi:hypothetical protein